MILASVKSTVQTSETLAHKQATISLNPVILHVLSKDLYQNHIESPFREILINAIDAHIEAGVARPVDIHLPTMWDEVFYIRDYGAGLSHERLMAIYLDYGNSDRRDTNDVHGGLGLGTKSPFAYTNSFMVNSWFGGYQRTYIIYYDEDNIPCVDLLDEAECNLNETGLKVQFTTVNPNDWLQFHTAATELLPRLPRETYNIDNLTAVSFGEEELVIPDSRQIGPVKLYKGSGVLSVTMGYVRYKLDPKTVKDYLNSRNIRITLDGQEFLVHSLLTKLLAVNNVEIVANIGDYPVHPSREYINVTPRAIGKLCEELKMFLTELFADDSLSLEEDASKYSITGLLSDDKAKLRVRARYLAPSKYYTYDTNINVPAQSTSYLSIVSHHSEWGGKLKVCFLDGTQLTDYVGNNRRHFKFPQNFPANTALLLVDNGMLTDGAVLQHLNTFEKFDVADAIADYLKEKDREATWYGTPQPSSKRVQKRTIVRSMQDSSHNILILKNFDGYGPGGRKAHWDSGKYNVASLQEMKKFIFWLPTRVGCAGVTETNMLRSYAEIRHLIPEWKQPIFIGLPASKGTLAFEKAFKPLAELPAWMEEHLNGDSVKRKIKLAVLIEETTRVNNTYLDAVQPYGPANWIKRLQSLTKYAFGALRNTNDYVKFHDLVADTKKSPEAGKIRLILQDLSIKFPLTLVSWGYNHNGLINANFLTDVLPIWAEEVALLTNNQPTGMRYKR